MAFTPDPPFPKTPGNPIMAKDWNDSIGELQRLDTAKVSRSGADAMTGPLTIAGALAVGTSTPPSARLHVVDAVSPAVTRLQTTATNGSARLELWSDPRGSGTEWRPGYIESFDTGTYTGGLRFVTNGTGLAARTGAMEQLRLVNGLAGFGVTDPAFRIDASGQLRIRQGTSTAAGIHFHQATPNANRAFVGMMNDNTVGLMGAPNGNWGLQMEIFGGNVGIKGAPISGSVALAVTGDSQVSQNHYVLGNAAIGHASPGYRLDVAGRSRFRDGNGSAGLWLYQSAAAVPQDRAFIGMANDSTVGLFGNTGGAWGLLMDTSTGNLTANGYLTASRVWTGNYHTEVTEATLTSTNSTNWVQIGNLSLTFTLPVARPCWFHLLVTGVDLSGVTGNWSVGFRLNLDGFVFAYFEPYFNVQAGVFETRHVDLAKFRSVGAGTHTVKAEWYVHGGTINAGEAGSDRTLQVVEF